MQGKVAECNTHYNLLYGITSTGSYSLSSFPEILPILLPPEPSSRWALRSQSLAAFRPARTSAAGPWHRARRFQQQVLSYHPRPPCTLPSLVAALICAATRWARRRGWSSWKPACLQKAEGCVPGRPGPRGSRAWGPCRCVWGACTCTLVPATCPSNRWVQVPSKPQQQDFASSLHYSKLLTCMTLEQRKVSPRRSTCVSHNPRTGSYEEKGSPRGRLSLRL